MAWVVDTCLLIEVAGGNDSSPPRSVADLGQLDEDPMIRSHTELENGGFRHRVAASSRMRPGSQPTWSLKFSGRVYSST